MQPDLPLIRRVIDASAKVLLLAEEKNAEEPLGGVVPVAIVSGVDEWEEVAEELDDVFLGDAEVWRRGAELDANPRGGKQPYVSPDGAHTIVDIKFEDPIGKKRWKDGFLLFGEPATPYQIAAELNSTEGVLTHGIVTQADAVYLPGGSWGDEQGKGGGEEGGGDPVEIIVDRKR